MTDDRLTVLLVGAGARDVEEDVAREAGFVVERCELAGALARLEDGDVDIVLLGLEGSLEPLEALRAGSPGAAVVALVGSEDRAVGAAAVRAEAEDYLVRGELAPGLVAHVLRHAAERHRLRRELADLITRDESTRMWNLRGFLPLAEHQLRWADRTGKPVVLVFVRLDELESVVEARGSEEGERLVAEAAAVVREAVRDSDVAARIAPDTFCVMLTGGVAGAEVTVLSRLVEAIAVRSAGREERLAISVGSALYDPQQPEPLGQIVETAGRRMSEREGFGRSEG